SRNSLHCAPMRHSLRMSRPYAGAVRLRHSRSGQSGWKRRGYWSAAKRLRPDDGALMALEKFVSARCTLQRTPAAAGKLSDGQAFQPGRRGDRSPDIGTSRYPDGPPNSHACERFYVAEKFESKCGGERISPDDGRSSLRLSA